MKKRQVWIKPEIRKEFEEKIIECLSLCQPHHHETIPVPQLLFKNIGGNAGHCRFDFFVLNSIIVINPAYFQKENGYNEQLTNTLPHEVAHHVCDYIHRKEDRLRPHGWQWAKVMQWMGRKPARCHKMNGEGIINRHERPYSYKCGCQTAHLLTARMHISIQRKGKERVCRRCHKRIVFQGISVKGAFLPTSKPIEVSVKPAVEKVLTPVTVPDSKFRVTTKFVDGILQNVRVPVEI